MVEDTDNAELVVGASRSAMPLYSKPHANIPPQDAERQLVVTLVSDNEPLPRALKVPPATVLPPPDGWMSAHTAISDDTTQPHRLVLPGTAITPDLAAVRGGGFK